MASFTSILTDVGKGLKAFFTSTPVKEAEAVALPLVEKFFPDSTTLITGIMAEAGKVEAMASAVGAQTGTGAQKLALVLQTGENLFNDYEKSRGVTISSTGKETIVNALVAILNALPATTTTAA